MDTLSFDRKEYVESDLVDIGLLPLAALSSWRGTAIRSAISAVVRDLRPARVCDQSAQNDWTN